MADKKQSVAIDEKRSVIVQEERPIIESAQIDPPFDTLHQLDHQLHKHGLPKHHLFCNTVGMLDPFHGNTVAARKQEATFFTKLFGDLFASRIRGQDLYPRVKTDFKWCMRQYWFFATVSNMFLWLQIVLGATLASLGGTKSNKVSIAIVVLGAIQTVIAGLLTWFKSRNQPNRARQLANALRKAMEAIEDAEARFRDPVCQDTVQEVVRQLADMYQAARTEAEINYPDYWVSTTGVRMLKEEGQKIANRRTSVP